MSLLPVDSIDECQNIRAIQLKLLQFCSFDFDPKSQENAFIRFIIYFAFNDSLENKVFIKNHVNRHRSQLIYDIILFHNNFSHFVITDFDSLVKFEICSRIPSSEGF